MMKKTDFSFFEGVEVRGHKFIVYGKFLSKPATCVLRQRKSDGTSFLRSG